MQTPLKRIKSLSRSPPGRTGSSVAKNAGKSKDIRGFFRSTSTPKLPAKDIKSTDKESPPAPINVGNPNTPPLSQGRVMGNAKSVPAKSEAPIDTPGIEHQFPTPSGTPTMTNSVGRPIIPKACFSPQRLTSTPDPHPIETSAKKAKSSPIKDPGEKKAQSGPSASRIQLGPGLDTMQLKGGFSGSSSPLWAGNECVFPDDKKVIVFGRNPTQSDFIVDSTEKKDLIGISRRHAKFQRQQDRSWRILQIGSGAIVVNGIRVDTHELRDGDVITFPSGAASLEPLSKYTRKPGDTPIKLIYRHSAKPVQSHQLSNGTTEARAKPEDSIDPSTLTLGMRVLVRSPDTDNADWGYIIERGKKSILIKWDSPEFENSGYSVKELCERVVRCEMPNSPSTNGDDGAANRVSPEIDQKNHRGETLLHREVNKGNLAGANKAIDRGASVNTNSMIGKTPLHDACGRGFKDLASLLIGHMANVNAVDCKKRTPLHDAAANGRADCVKFLIESGADTGLECCDGNTAADLSKNKAVRSLLEPRENIEEENSRNSKRRRVTDMETKSEVQAKPSKKRKTCTIPGTGEDINQFQPKRVAKSRWWNGELQYLIEWCGSTKTSDRTWEPAAKIQEVANQACRNERTMSPMLTCTECGNTRLIIRKDTKCTVQAESFTCSKVKRKCQEPCDQGRKLVREEDPQLLESQSSHWNEIQEARSDALQCILNGNTDKPTSQLEEKLWAFLDDILEDNENFLSLWVTSSDAVTISELLRGLHSRLSDGVKLSGYHLLLLTILLCSPNQAVTAERNNRQLQTKQQERTRSWCQNISYILSESILNSCELEGSCKSGYIWHTWHMLLILAYIPVYQRNIDSVTVMQVYAARQVVHRFATCAQPKHIRAIMHSNPRNLRNATTAQVDTLFPMFADKDKPSSPRVPAHTYWSGMLQVTQLILSHMYASIPSERASLAERLYAKYINFTDTGKRIFVQSIEHPNELNGSFKEAVLIMIFTRSFPLLKSGVGSSLKTALSKLAIINRSAILKISSTKIDELVTLFTQFALALLHGSEYSDVGSLDIFQNAIIERAPKNSALQLQTTMLVQICKSLATRGGTGKS